MKKFNKFGVPYHKYDIDFNNGDGRIIDIGYEEDWGHIQQAFDKKGKEYIGWGDDENGHLKIVKVVDCETGKKINPFDWATNYVWIYAEKYSQ